jgi:predicted TPR repeat methyltransferase
VFSKFIIYSSLIFYSLLKKVRNITITTSKKYLNQVYKYKTDNQTKDLYDEWYSSYDEELTNNIYTTPKRCAEALSRNLLNKNSEILDIGCGTGLSGQEIMSKGFNNIDGSDFSEKMLEEAKLKNVYRNLFIIDLNKNNYKLIKSYEAIIAAGVISPNHANPECLKNCFDYLKPNGVIIFSLNDHAFSNKLFMNQIDKIIEFFKFKIIEKEYGEHLLKINLKSWIYVLKR